MARLIGLSRKCCIASRHEQSAPHIFFQGRAEDHDAFQQDEDDSCSSPRPVKLTARCLALSTGTERPPRSCVRMKMSAAKGRIAAPQLGCLTAAARDLLPAMLFFARTCVGVRIRSQRFHPFPRLLDAGRCGQLIKMPCHLRVPAHAICLP
jgi:hypothetical protein